MREIIKKAGELEIGDNIVEDGHIYMVTGVTFNDDDMTVTVKVGYPRTIVAGGNLLTSFKVHTSRETFVMV